MKTERANGAKRAEKLRGFGGGARAGGLWGSSGPEDSAGTKGAEQAAVEELFFPDAEPWPEPVDGAALLDELEGVFRRFVMLPEHAAGTLALWVVHTYAFQLRDVSTYIGVESPEKRCGKTTLLSLLAELAHRPVTAANISSSAIFRVIEKTGPTLIIDEADTFLRSDDEMRGILNSGYTRKTAFVVRATRKKGSGLARFSCWCPKVMATIGRLGDSLSDRCIVLRMHRKLPGESCERLRDLPATGLRGKCARFVRDHIEEISSIRPTAPEGLNDRAMDVWEPLLVLAEIAGAGWAEKARRAATGLAAATQGPTPGGALLLDVFAAFTLMKAERLFSRELVERLNEWTDRPWQAARQGRPVNELWLAQQLRGYGIRTRNLRVGSRVARGYALEDMRDVFKRYISEADVKERTECMMHLEREAEDSNESENL